MRYVSYKLHDLYNILKEKAIAPPEGRGWHIYNHFPLVGYLAVLETVRVTLERVNALSPLVAHIYRLYRFEYIQVVCNRRLREPEYLGKFGNCTSLCCFSEETHKLVATFHPYHFKTIRTKLLI